MTDKEIIKYDNNKMIKSVYSTGVSCKKLTQVQNDHFLHSVVFSNIGHFKVHFMSSADIPLKKSSPKLHIHNELFRLREDAAHLY